MYNNFSTPPYGRQEQSLFRNFPLSTGCRFEIVELVQDAVLLDFRPFDKR